MATENRIAGAFALFGAVSEFAAHSGPVLAKLAMAGAIAVCTGGGYKLGSWILHVLIVKLKKRSWPPPPP